MKSLVYIDHFRGEVQPASWEALGLAKSLGTAIAVVFGKDAEAALVRAEELVAPVHRLAEGLMAGRRQAPPRHEEPESVTQSPGDLGQGERSRSGCGELQRQRQSLQSLADLRHRWRMFRIPFPRTCPAGSAENNWPVLNPQPLS